MIRRILILLCFPLFCWAEIGSTEAGFNGSSDSKLLKDLSEPCLTEKFTTDVRDKKLTIISLSFVDENIFANGDIPITENELKNSVIADAVGKCKMNLMQKALIALSLTHLKQKAEDYDRRSSASTPCNLLKCNKNNTISQEPNYISPPAPNGETSR